MDVYFPKYCVWETTLKCNLVCRHCGSTAGAAREDELSTQEALDLLEQLAELGTQELTLSGGELLMRPDWRELAAYSHQLGICNLIVSNGLAITPEVAEEMARLEIGSVSISLDGGKDVHNYLRPVGKCQVQARDSFSGVLNAITNLQKAGVIVAAITQMNKVNLGELGNIKALLLERGIRYWQIQLTNPMGRAGRAAVPGIDPSDLIGIYDFIRITQKEGELHCLAANNIGYFGSDEHYLRRRNVKGD